MSHFNINIADVVIEIDTIHVLPYALSRSFSTNEPSVFTIHSTQADIDETKSIFQSVNGLNASWDGNIEMIVVLRKLAEGLINYNTVVMHGAAIAVNNNAFLFIADSGVGKTTHVLKWLNRLPDSYIVNGDKPFIRIEHQPFVYGSPWAGKENLYTNTKVPLKAIIIMTRNDDNIMNELSFSKAFIDLYKQVYRPKDTEKMKKTLSLLKAFDQRVSFYHFKFNNFKDDCFDVAYNTLIAQR